MASVRKAIPLGDFTKLTATTLVYNPPDHSSTSPTILLHTWMNAAPSNIQFYFRKWRSLLPTARIILILGIIPNMVYVSTDAQKKNLEPVLSLLRAEPASPLYAHLFSNAGSQSMAMLLRAFRDTSTDQTTLLPLKGIILDSAPSRGTYESAYTGMSYEVARSPFYIRYPGLALIHAILAIIVIRQTMFGTPNPISQLNSELNDGDLMTQGIPHVYIYSKEDRLVKWEDIENHGAVAGSKGWPVEMEMFSGTDHCRHGKGPGEERYWSICRKMVSTLDS